MHPRAQRLVPGRGGSSRAHPGHGHPPAQHSGTVICSPGFWCGLASVAAASVVVLSTYYFLACDSITSLQGCKRLSLAWDGRGGSSPSLVVVLHAAAPPAQAAQLEDPAAVGAQGAGSAANPVDFETLKQENQRLQAQLEALRVEGGTGGGEGVPGQARSRSWLAPGEGDPPSPGAPRGTTLDGLRAQAQATPEERAHRMAGWQVRGGGSAPAGDPPLLAASPGEAAESGVAAWRETLRRPRRGGGGRRSDSGDSPDEVLRFLRTSAGAGRPRPRELPVTKIAYIKTHKTGSTTVGGILFRFAARHNLNIYRRGHVLQGVPPTAAERGTYDVVLHHHTNEGYMRGGRLAGSMGALADWYRSVAGPQVRLLTILREPMSHFLSWYSYYKEPAGQSLHQVLAVRTAANSLAAEFGLYSEADVRGFIQNHLPRMEFLLLEKFRRSLLLMRHRFNWEMRDLTYLKVFESDTDDGKGPLRRWDGRPVKPTPNPSSLPPDIVARIREQTTLDQMLYDAAVKIADERYEQAVREAGEENWQRDVVMLRGWQRSFTRACKDTPGGGGGLGLVCRWYQLCDLCYQGLIPKGGGRTAAYWGDPGEVQRKGDGGYRRRR